MGKKVTELHEKLLASENERARAIRVARVASAFIQSIVDALPDEDKVRARNIIENIKSRELEGWKL